MHYIEVKILFFSREERKEKEERERGKRKRKEKKERERGKRKCPKENIFVGVFPY